MKKTLIKLIAIPFFILGLTGCSMIDEINEKHRIEKLAAKTNIDIRIKEAHKEYKENTEKLLDQIESLYNSNPWLLNNVKHIVICEDVLKETGAKGDYRIKNGTYAGMADIKTNTIYISARDYSEDVVIHESAHMFDASFGDELLSQNKDFYKMANENYSSIDTIFDYPDRAKCNINEFFVNLVIDYTEKQDGKVLKQNFPNIYEYIDRFAKKAMANCKSNT